MPDVKPSAPSVDPEALRSAVATEMFALVRRLRAPALDAVLHFVHQVREGEPSAVVAKTETGERGLQLTLTLPAKKG